MKKIFKPAKAICPLCGGKIDYDFDYYETQRECLSCKHFFRITLKKVDLEEGIIEYLKKLDTFSIFDYTIKELSEKEIIEHKIKVLKFTKKEIPEIDLPETAKMVINKPKEA